MMIQDTLVATILGHSSRGIEIRLERGRANMKAAPNITRSMVTTPGWKLSSPIAMKRNELPQIALSETKSAQSLVLKDERLVPTVVLRMLLLTGDEPRSRLSGCTKLDRLVVAS
jgi:hypothetical protein